MLKNQDADNPSQASSQASASPPRVTPEELSQALAAIETRRQAEASHLAGTIPIDQAVSELHLDSTSDEIWAEVQAQRAKAAAAQREQMQREQAQAAQQQHSIAPRTKHRRGWMGLLTPLLIFWVLFQTGVIPHSWSHPTHAAAPMLRPLAQVPDGQEFYGNNDALAQVSSGKPLAQIKVDTNPEDNLWRMVKIGAHVYLRGYIARTDSLQPLQGNALHVYNDDNSGELEREQTSNITLRVDKIPLQKSGGDDDYSEITVPNFQPDPLTTLSPWH